MDKREVKIEYAEYTNSYPEEYQKLCQTAVNIIPNAYSIYSKFSVGAAVLLENGTIIPGTNQENAAYPSGMCAERTALYYAGTAFPDVPVKAIAIAACNKGVPTTDIIPPCGACRQVMAETIKRYHDFDVIMVGTSRTVKIKASGLLPFSFDLK